jgi:hypothetical protein
MRRITQLFVNRPPLVFVLIALITLGGLLRARDARPAAVSEHRFPDRQRRRLVSRCVAVGAARFGRAPGRGRDRGRSESGSHHDVDPTEPGLDLRHVHARFQSNDRPDGSPRPPAIGQGGAAAGSPGPGDALVRSGPIDDRHVIADLTVAEHRDPFVDHHERYHPRSRTGRRRLERQRERVGHAGARGAARSRAALEPRLRTHGRRQCDPGQQRARPRRHRVLVESRDLARRARGRSDPGVDRSKRCLAATPPFYKARRRPRVR